MALVICRVAIAWLLFTIISIPVWEKIESQHYGRLILCMLCGVTLNQILFLQGLRMTKPINASLIMTTLPIVAITASHYLLKELVTLPKVLGILLGVVGVSLIIAYGHQFNISREGIVGDVLVLLNACCFGLFLVIVKPLLLRYHPFQVMAIVFGIGSVLLLTTSGGEIISTQWQQLPTSIYWAIAYVVVLTTFVAYVMNTYALQHLPASIVGAYIYLQPVIATTIALILEKDRLNAVKVAGALLIFIGIYLVSRQTNSKSVYPLDSSGQSD